MIDLQGAALHDEIAGEGGRVIRAEDQGADAGLDERIGGAWARGDAGARVRDGADEVQDARSLGGGEAGIENDPVANGTVDTRPEPAGAVAAGSAIGDGEHGVVAEIESVAGGRNDDRAKLGGEGIDRRAGAGGEGEVIQDSRGVVVAIGGRWDDRRIESQIARVDRLEAAGDPRLETAGGAISEGIR